MRAVRGKSRFPALMLALAAGVVVAGAWWLLDEAPVDEQLTTTPNETSGVADGLEEPPAASTVATPAPMSLPPSEAATPAPDAVDESLHPAFRTLPEDESLPLLVFGKVTDEAIAPIEGATVYLRPDVATRRALSFPKPLTGDGDTGKSIDQFVTTTTDRDGRFELLIRRAPGSSARAYIAIDAAGYGPFGDWIHGNSQRAIAVEDTVLVRAAALAGRVIDEYGQAVEGAETLLDVHTFDRSAVRHRSHSSCPEFLRNAITGNDGTFTIHSGWPGTANVRVHHAEYADTKLADVALTADKPAHLGDVTLTRGWTARGRVVQRDGTPVEAARITHLGRWQPTTPALLHDAVELKHAQPTVHATRTDADGRFTLERLSDSSVALAIDAKGFRPALLPDVRPGAPDELVSLETEGRLIVSVTASDTGEALHPIAIDALEHPKKLSQAARPGSRPFDTRVRGRLDARATDDPSVWEVSGCDKRGVVMWIDVPGYASAGHAIETSAAPAITRVTLALERECTVRGRVLNDAGEPIEGADVSARSPGSPTPLSQPPRSTVTDEDGFYTLERLGAGRTSMLTHADRHHMASQAFELADGAAKIVDFELARLTRVEVRVTDADGRPYTPQTVEGQIGDWDFGDHHVYLKHESGDSDYASWIEPGLFISEVTLPGRYVATMEPGARAELDVRLGETSEATLSLQRWPIVRGTVLANGEPVDGAIVSYVSKAADEFAALGMHADAWPPEYTSDALGRFEFTIDGEGEYYVTARFTGSSDGRTLVNLSYDNVHDVLVDVSVGRIEGIVLNTATGEPVGGVKLHSSSFETIITPDDGSFAIELVAVGDVNVLVNAPDFAPVERITTTVTRGETTSLQIDVTPGARVEILCLDESGEPLSNKPRRQPRYMVTLHLRDDDRVRHVTARLEDGKATFGGVIAGTYDVGVSRGQDQVGATTLTIEGTTDASVTVRVTTGP